MDVSEEAASIVQPHFDAVREVFLAWRPRGVERPPLEKLRKLRFVVDPKGHNSPRHFAAARDDGKLLLFAPEFVDLPVETVVAIMTHEFGHAADHAYPAQFLMPPGGPGKAQWIGDLESKEARRWRSLWGRRSRDQIEWAADGIAEAVTGQHLTYCGDCLLQCFGGRGIERPAGLR